MEPQTLWSAAVGSDPAGPVLARQTLYQDVLRLERMGGSIVMRKLLVADIALSLDSALCIWTDEILKVLRASHSAM